MVDAGGCVQDVLLPYQYSLYHQTGPGITIGPDGNPWFCILNGEGIVGKVDRHTNEVTALASHDVTDDAATALEMSSDGIVLCYFRRICGFPDLSCRVKAADSKLKYYAVAEGCTVMSNVVGNLIAQSEMSARMHRLSSKY